MTAHERHSNPAHPLRRWRVTESIVAVGGASLVALAAWWSLAEHEPASIQPEDRGISPESVTTKSAQPTLATVDPTSFDVALWNPPMPPPPPPPAAPAPRQVAQRIPPLNVQLLAIVRRPVDGTLAAVLYDPKSDTLYTLGTGEMLFGHTIAHITGDVVSFRADSTETRFSLMPEAN